MNQAKDRSARPAPVAQRPSTNSDRGFIGQTRVAVTPLGFGGTGIGNLFRAVDDATANGAVDAAWEAGVRFFDTAPLYGFGLSEERLGEALRQRPRDEYVLCTKVGRIVTRDQQLAGSHGVGLFGAPRDRACTADYSTSGALRSVEASLRRLGVDRLDLVLVHDPDDHMSAALSETLPALARLRDEGVIGAIGAGMNQWQALDTIVRQSDVDVVMVAGRWTLVDRSARPLLDRCLERGVSVLAAAPFNSGLLARAEPAWNATFDYARATPQQIFLARRVAELARAHGTTLPAAALQAPLRHPAVAAVVAGMSNSAEVAQAVTCFSDTIPPSFWGSVEDLLPRRP